MFNFNAPLLAARMDGIKCSKLFPKVGGFHVAVMFHPLGVRIGHIGKKSRSTHPHRLRGHSAPAGAHGDRRRKACKKEEERVKKKEEVSYPLKSFGSGHWGKHPAPAPQTLNLNSMISPSWTK